MLEGIVAAVLAQLAQQVLGVDELVESVAESVGKSAGGSLAEKVKGYRDNKKNSEALENALRGAVEATNHRFASFVDDGEGFSWEFLCSDRAADQLAQALIVGGQPQPQVLVRAWAQWYTSVGSPEVVEDRRAAAAGPMKFLLEDWTSRVRGLNEFAERTERRDVGRAADAVEALARHQGAVAADGWSRDEYLRRVVWDHEFLETTGTGTGDRRIPLGDVFVSLSAVPHRAQGDRDRREFDAKREALEAELEAGAMSVVEFEQRLDALAPTAKADAGVAVSVGEAAATNDKLVVLGDPGSGKTTMLRWLALRHATALLHDEKVVSVEGEQWQTPARLPIFVRAGSLVDFDDWNELSLDEFMYRHFKANSYPEPESLRQLLKDQLERGQALVLLDAMDEIPDAGDRRAVAERVKSFVRAWERHGNRFVVTSRFGGYQSAPITGFTHFEATDMTPDQVQAFLDSYCPALERLDRPEATAAEIHAAASDRITRITDAIDRSRGVARLAVNPLLLTILVIVQRASYEIPTKRAGAYQKAVAALEHGWRVGNKVDPDVLPDEHLLRASMIELAWWTHRERPAGIVTFDDIITAIGTQWANEHRISRLDDGSWPKTMISAIKTFIETVERDCGLLHQRAPQRWAFLHQTFQEFYVAQHFLSQPSPAEAMRRRLHDPRYHEPLLLALGIETHVNGRPNAAELTEAVIYGTGPFATPTDSEVFQTSDYEDLLERDLDFAYAAAADDLKLPTYHHSHLVTHATTTITNFRLRGVLPDRIAALRGTVTGTNIAQQLGSLAETDSDSDVRRRAAEALGQLGDTNTALSVLRSLAETNSNSDVRRLAAEALGQLGDTSDETLTVLRSLAETNSNSNVRRDAAKALGQLGGLRPPWPQ